jgi:hypothetical protein
MKLRLGQIEILPSGEEGPRLLDESKIMKIRGIPFLTVSEFIRAKLKAWVMYAEPYLSVLLDLLEFPVVVQIMTLKTSFLSLLDIGTGSTSIVSMNRTCIFLSHVTRLQQRRGSLYERSMECECKLGCIQGGPPNLEKHSGSDFFVKRFGT